MTFRRPFPLLAAVTLATLLPLAGCARPDTANQQAEIDNAMDADAAATEAADDRAQHLDRQAGALLDAANATRGAAATALRNEAGADLSDAAAIRQQGQASGAAVEERMERADGLLNGQ